MKKHQAIGLGELIWSMACQAYYSLSPFARLTVATWRTKSAKHGKCRNRRLVEHFFHCLENLLYELDVNEEMVEARNLSPSVTSSFESYLGDMAPSFSALIHQLPGVAFTP